METPKDQNNITQEEILLAKARANKKGIISVAVAVVIAVVIVMGWMLISQNGSKKADELASRADMEQTDSLALDLYKEAAKAGYKSGNRAKVEVAIRLFNDGKYEEAIKYLDDASISDDIVAAGVESLKGDCYANLDNADKALKCYKDAVDKADKNPAIVPILLVKQANIYRAQGDFTAEAKAYKTILDDYPQYVQTSQTDIRKYYERALASSK